MSPFKEALVSSRQSSKLLGIAMATGSLCLALVLALALGACDDQPPIRCLVQTSLGFDAIGRFTPAGQPSAIPGAPADACVKQISAGNLPAYAPSPGGTNTAPGPDPRLDLLGLETYYPGPVDPNLPTTPSALSLKAEWIGDRIQDAQVNAANDMTLPDGLRAALAQYPYAETTPPYTIGQPPALPPADPTNPNRPYAFGRFDAVYPDANGVCSATLAPSEMDYPGVPAHSVFVAIPPDGSYAQLNSDGTPGAQPEVPASHVRYEWSGFRVIVSPEAGIGVQAFADLSITRDGCRADYRVSILSPRVSCTALDESGNPILPGRADPALCSPNAASKSPYGSGLYPGIPVSCEQIGFDPMAPDFECLPTRTAP
jgi:hypothetical protein